MRTVHPYPHPAMSSLYEREGRYYVQYTDRARNPQKRRFSLSTDNPRTAARLQHRADHLYESGAWDPWKTPLEEALFPDRFASEPDEPSFAFEALKERFLARPNLTEKTRRGYEYALRLFKEGVPSAANASGPDPEEVRRFLLSGSEGRAASYRRTYRTFVAEAIRQGHLPGRPEDYVPKTGARNRARLLFFAEADIALLLETIRKEAEAGRADPALARWLSAVVETGPYLGLRRQEFRTARVEHLDPSAQRLRIPAEHAKSRNDESVYVPDAVWPTVEHLAATSTYGYLFEYPGARYEGQPSEDFYTRAFADFRERAGLREGSVHTLRHTCASWLAQKGVAPQFIQQHLRHRSMDTTMRYMHLAPQHVEDALDRAFEPLPQLKRDGPRAGSCTGSGTPST